MVHQNETLKTQLVGHPSQILLDNWKLWMAKEVVEQWQSNQEVQLNLDDTLNNLNVTKNNYFNVLLEQLKLKIELTKKTIVSLQQLEQERTNLEEYFFQKIINKTQEAHYSIRDNTLKIFDKLVASDCHHASPQKLILFFKKLSEGLSWLRNKFEKQRINYLKKESSSWQAYFRLSEKLNSSSGNTLEDKGIEESIWNAISLGFESKLNIEKYAIYNQVIVNLIQLCQSYYNSANRSLKLLKKIEVSLKKKSSLDLISLPVFTNLKKIDTKTQRRLIEVWIGHSLNYWGNSPVSWQQIEAKLLENIEPVALALYKDFEHCFIEHTTREVNEKRCGS